jgi:hypothetical protein
MVERKWLMLLLLLCSQAMGQNALPDSTDKANKVKKRTGWTWAALPVVAYDADMGLQFGALGQVFDYGDGSSWPDYRHTIYGECSWFSRGSAVFQLYYDSKYLIPGGIRLTVDVDYVPDNALDFYGFNGYESNFDPGYATEGSSGYISRMYYRMERKTFRSFTDFQGPILGKKLRWMAGINVISMKTATVDIARLNKGKDEADKLPDTALLYDRYVQYGLIALDEKDGGTTILLKAGFIIDTRDHEASPNRGVWTDIFLATGRSFYGSTYSSYTRLVAMHRQYITVVPGTLVAAGQLGFQGTIAGKTPFFMASNLFISNNKTTKSDGLGGAKTLRGIVRSRVVGDGVAWGNLELRLKFLRRMILKQSVYFGLTGFCEGGLVVIPRKIDQDLVPEPDRTIYFSGKSETLHGTVGLGLRIGLNENFIISVDYGKSMNPQDGTSGLYVGIGNIF